MSSSPRSCREWLGQIVLSDLPTNRRWSYLFFSLALFVALGSQNFLWPVKSAVFLDVVGAKTEPFAKSLCVVVLLPCLLFYSILISYIKSPARLVATVGGVYVFLFLLIAWPLRAGGRPQPWVAWTLYYATETKGVIVMPMIWSVIAQVSTSDLAKQAYPIMFFVIQFGGIIGSFMAIKVDSLGGEVNLLLFQVACFAFIIGFVWAACHFSTSAASKEAPLLQPQGGEAEQLDAAPPPKSFGRRLMRELYKGGEGLHLLLSRPYVFMAFWVSYAQLMPRTVLDYQNQVLAVASFPDVSEKVAFFGKVSLYTNCGTAVLTLLGTRPLIEFFGVGRCLLALPVGMFLGVLALCVHHTLEMSAATVVCVSILAYGLNAACKEILYVRTSREIKFKAKSWSEMYGNQVMKLAGGQFNLWVNIKHEAGAGSFFNPELTILGTGLWIVLWFGIALSVGMMNRRLELEDKVIS